MPQPLIAIDGVSKQYTIGAHPIHDSLRESLADVFRRNPHAHRTTETFWALQDVNLTIREGDRIGIIGNNGAGKSTLLKIISRITPPTRGTITVRGRVSALLEVGTGFHPELTGRENIYLNGTILGMSRREIGKKFDEIVEFAEIEKFLDTPVKRYSSGMHVRLAFAIAAHLEPEILIVDEVLAVGDAQFQKKCLSKIREVGGRGQAVIFVSHSIEAIRSLCTKCLFLKEGRTAGLTDVEEAIRAYQGAPDVPIGNHALAAPPERTHPGS